MVYYTKATSKNILYRKARSFIKGTLEGFLGIFALPTMARKEFNGELYQGDYRNLGRISGFLFNMIGHMVVYNSLSYENSMWTFLPFTVTNLVSSTYEFGRYLGIINKNKY